MTALLVALGAAVGAPLRFAVERRLASAYPWGTFAVNLTGSAILGVLLGVLRAQGESTSWVLTLVGVGFCGSLTTFGGYAAQVLDFVAAPRATPGSARVRHAAEYAVASVLACVAVALVGYLGAVALLGGAG
ncbi:MAG TPA: CrcB family protein [Candidatus Nanopelagicales bacterium]|nr:CrcB family protein [Candidatus Nanopelagicales bacterium]